MRRENDELERWNQRYRQGSHSSRAPDPLLVAAYEQFIQPLFPHGGRCLDLAGGIGRHALWLAQRSWQVTLVEGSEVALAKAQTAARRKQLDVHTVMTDLRQALPRLPRFDLLLVFFYLNRGLLPELPKLLKPGGLLIYKTYTLEQLRFSGGPKRAMYLLRPNELLRAFSKLRTLHYHETVAPKATAELIAQRRT